MTTVVQWKKSSLGLLATQHAWLRACSVHALPCDSPAKNNFSFWVCRIEISNHLVHVSAKRWDKNFCSNPANKRFYKYSNLFWESLSHSVSCSVSMVTPTLCDRFVIQFHFLLSRSLADTILDSEIHLFFSIALHSPWHSPSLLQ